MVDQQPRIDGIILDNNRPILYNHLLLGVQEPRVGRDTGGPSGTAKISRNPGILPSKRLFLGLSSTQPPRIDRTLVPSCCDDQLVVLCHQKAPGFHSYVRCLWPPRSYCGQSDQPWIMDTICEHMLKHM